MKNYQDEIIYLEHVLKSINDEIKLSKEISEMLKKEGITLSFEDTKRGAHLNISAKLEFYANKIKRLTSIIPSPYFGKIEFMLDEDLIPRPIYIGKISVNKDGEILVTDWRAPISNLYYDSNIGTTKYNSPEGPIIGKLLSKKQIIIENSQLIDVVDSSLATNDELLRQYLSVNADNKMKTIVESIQKEQNQIIRRPITDNIIVQGVAGSGKTSVALHRIAYLIYNLTSEINSTNFLVLGPNNYFLDYISSVLPELETESVSQKTYLNLVNQYLKEKLTLDTEEKNIKRNEKLTYQKIQTYQSSLEFKIALDHFLELLYTNGLIFNNFEIDGEIIFTKEEIKEALFLTSKQYPDFDKTCKYFISKYKENIDNIYDKLNKKYRDIYINLPKEDPLRKELVDKSHELYILIKDKGIKLLKEYFKRIKLKPVDIYKLFIANLDSSNTSLSSEEIELLQKKTLLNLKRKKVTFEDLPALLHINYILTGKKLDYKHIVIDEAQDYGLFHFDAIKEIASEGTTFSIYGDLAQAIYSYKSINSWEQVNQLIFNNRCNLLKLSKSYRTTIEITNNANQVLEQIGLDIAEPVIRHGKNIEFLETSEDYEYKIINEWINKGYKTIAIICKTEKEAKEVHKKLSKQNITAKYISENDSQYSGGVFVLTSASAKGLEFDAVIINNASSTVYLEDSDVDMHLLYVACTRALHEQLILYKGEITKPFENKVKNNILIKKRKK